MQNDESNARPPGDRRLYGRVLRLARAQTRPLALLFVLDLLDGLFVLLTPVPLKIAVDSVVGSRPLPGLIAWALPEASTSAADAALTVAVALLLGVAVLHSLQALASGLLRGHLGERLVLELRGRLFRHAQDLSLYYHDGVGTADTLYRIQKDASAVENLVVEGALPVAGAVLKVGLMFAVTLWLDWQLGLVAALIAPVLLLLSARYRSRLRQQARDVKRLESGALGVVQESLAALREVKAFGQEERQTERFVRQTESGIRARVRLLLYEGSYSMAIRLTAAAGTAAVLSLGVLHVRSGDLTLGDLLLVLGYLAQLYSPLKTISRKAGGLQSHLASMERAFALLDQRPEVADRPGALALDRARGAVTFRNVSFGYDGDRRVLRDVSFHLEPGTRLGLVGATGAGKTTLLNLLLRFFDPGAGAILLDGRDLRDYRLVDLRRQFALVLQDSVLFSATVAANIAYGRPGATPAEVEAAARAAHAHEFVARLPAGYDTPLGERGMRLSGGERQRIALARAFLKDAPILLLDEPTSAVDRHVEADILEAMNELMRGRTSIIVTHRHAPLAICDQILNLSDGRLGAVSVGPTPLAALADGDFTAPLLPR